MVQGGTESSSQMEFPELEKCAVAFQRPKFDDRTLFIRDSKLMNRKKSARIMPVTGTCNDS